MFSLYYDIIDTNSPYLFGFLVFKDKVVLTKTSKDYKEIENTIGDFLKQLFPSCVKIKASQKSYKNFSNEIKKYFNGEKIKKFSIPYSLESFKEFEKKVLELTSLVPYGKFTSYKELSKAIRLNSYRAVGNSLSKNPVPILVPCHRVIKSNFNIGFFTGEEGLKDFLLRLEGIDIKDKKILDREKFFVFNEL